MDLESGIDRIEIYIDNELQTSLNQEPYTWEWNNKTPLRFRHTLTIITYDNAGNVNDRTITLWRFL